MDLLLKHGLEGETKILETVRFHACRGDQLD
jgi:hypothetical protein